MKLSGIKPRRTIKFLTDPSLHALVLLFLFGLAAYHGCSLLLQSEPQPGEVIVVEAIAPPDGCVGLEYFYDLNSYFAVYNLTPPLSYPWTGDLPDGLSLDEETGIISGMPERSGPFTFTVTVYQNGGAELGGEETFTILVCGFSIVTPFNALPPICIGSEYRALLEICGGEPSFSWTIGNWDPEELPHAFSEEDPDIHILELAADAHRTIHAVQHVPPTWYSRSLSARASG